MLRPKSECKDTYSSLKAKHAFFPHTQLKNKLNMTYIIKDMLSSLNVMHAAKIIRRVIHSFLIFLGYKYCR